MTNLNGFPAFPVLKLNEPAVQEGLTQFLKHVHEIGRDGNL